MIDFSAVNLSCLSAFGQDLTLTRQQTGEVLTFSGIIESGVQPEDVAPGSGTYTKCFTSLIALVTLPDKSDEVSTETTVYRVVDLIVDSAGGVDLLLRKDRDVE